MPRPEKVAVVDEIRERFESAQAVFLAEYAGLSVKAQQQLRRGLRESGAEFKVLKMTLTRRAAAGLEIDELDALLIGPTGVAFADGDPVAAAKVLKQFASDNEVFIVKGGLLGADLLSPERISELAEIEPREVLLAKLAGAMKAPMTAMASLLNALPRNAASVFGQLLEKKESGEVAAPAAEASAEPVAGEEAAAADDAAEPTPPDADDAPDDETGEEATETPDAADTPEPDIAEPDIAEPDIAEADIAVPDIAEAVTAEPETDESPTEVVEASADASSEDSTDDDSTDDDPTDDDSPDDDPTDDLAAAAEEE